jgi:hypothetical protein
VLWEEQARDAPTKMKKPTPPHDGDDQHRDKQGLDAPNNKSLRSRRSDNHPALPLPADHQHHLPGPPSRRTTARTRATTPHDPATRSPSCTGQTARRPRPSHQHPGPPPQPKSQTASSETASTEPTALSHSDTRQSPKPCKQLLRLMEHLPTMNPEAAASTHNHHPEPLPRRPLTPT